MQQSILDSLLEEEKDISGERGEILKRNVNFLFWQNYVM